MHISSFALLALPVLALSQDIVTAPSEVIPTPSPAQPIVLTLSQPTQTPSTLQTSVVPTTTDSLEYV